MHSSNTQTEIIFSIKKKDFLKFKSFLESFNLSAQNAEILRHWFYESAWNIESDDGEKLLVIFGRSQIHIIIRKDSNFEKLRDKFLSYVPYKSD